MPGALLRAVDSAFEMVGQNVWRVIMETLEFRYGVRREEFPEKLDLVHEGLVRALGTGASMLEMLILKRLYAELDMDMPSMIGQDFVASVNSTPPSVAARAPAAPPSASKGRRTLGA